MNPASSRQASYNPYLSSSALQLRFSTLRWRHQPRAPGTSQKTCSSRCEFSLPRSPRPSFLTAPRLQGPSVELLIGPKTATSTPLSYHLPRALLSVHSTYFRNEIARFTTTSGSTSFSSHSGTSASPASTASINTATITSTATTTSSYISPYAPQIHLPSIDPPIFGLFVKFIYTGSYPTSNDLRHASSPSSSSSSNATIPPSILAWTLGAFLHAPSFQNHAILHIYNSLGRAYALSPPIISYIWTKTSTSAAQPSELKRLALDVLVVHWSAATNIVSKSPALNDVWNDLFNAFPDLRREFIFGLQGGRKLLPVQGYFVTTSAPATEGEGRIDGSSAPARDGSASGAVRTPTPVGVPVVSAPPASRSESTTPRATPAPVAPPSIAPALPTPSKGAFQPQFQFPFPPPSTTAVAPYKPQYPAPAPDLPPSRRKTHPAPAAAAAAAGRPAPVVQIPQKRPASPLPTKPLPRRPPLVAQQEDRGVQEMPTSIKMEMDMDMEVEMETKVKKETN